jgi:hypothetical protein
MALANFTIRRQFNKLRATIYVDCEARTASVTLTYDRVIVRQEDISYYRVFSPETAEAWLARDAGERGSLLETLEWQYRNRVGIAA